jgi:lipopolysaccharide transport system permease protein
VLARRRGFFPGIPAIDGAIEEARGRRRARPRIEPPAKRRECRAVKAKEAASPPWLLRAARGIARESADLAARVWRARVLLVAVTRVEIQKKYSGAILGLLWYPLYSGLLLAMYCFIYMVVFPARSGDPSFGAYDHVLTIFAGLIPYLGFSEAVSTGATSIKGNIALVKNTVFPVELIPVKQVLVALASLSVSLAILIALILPTRHMGWHLLYLPVPILFLAAFCAGVVWILAALAVLVPDINYAVNLLLLFFLFVSPIGFTVSQIPPSAAVFVYLNPMTYLTESFRFALLGMRDVPMWLDAVFGAALLMFLAASGAFFRRLMPLFGDYE